MNLLIALATSATINTTPPDVVPLDPPAGKIPQAILARKPFKDKHPKIYSVARKVRTVAIFISPVVRLGGEVAQILLYVVPRK